MARVELGREITKLYSMCDERRNTKKYDEVLISKVFELSANILQLVTRNKISRKNCLALICVSTISKQECCFQDLCLNVFV